MEKLWFSTVFGLLVFAGSAFAGSAFDKNWSVDIGLGGTVVPGAWAPLRLEVPADLGPWTLEIRAVSVSGQESDPIPSFHSGGGTVEQPVFLADATRVLKLRFLSDGLVREQREVSLGSRLYPGHLIGVDGVGPRVRTALTQVLLPGEPVRVVSLPTSQLPLSPLSYGGLSALVVADPGAVLSPVQARALRAWVGSGGRLVIVDPRKEPGSLVTQVGAPGGLGRVETLVLPLENEAWKTRLDLEPFGQFHRLGTDFTPVAQGLPSQGSSATTTGLLLLLGWVVLGILLLVLRPKGGLGWPITWSLIGSLVVFLVWNSGAMAWDRGLPVHGREIVLPGSLGRFVWVEAAVGEDHSGPVNWPSTSPWALGLWIAEPKGPGAVFHTLKSDRVALESFLPPLERRARYRVVWNGSTLQWKERQGASWSAREQGPPESNPDRRWLEKTVAQAPHQEWSVGWDGSTCWIRPEAQGVPQ